MSKIGTKTELPPIFDTFCASKETRYSLTRPWTCTGYVCASNGACLVRMPFEGDLGNVNGPKHQDLFDSWTGSLETVPPTLPESDGRCDACDGKGFTVPCSNKTCCDGEIYVNSWGESRSCRACKGNGRIGRTSGLKCDRCLSLGFSRYGARVGHHRINHNYIRAVLTQCGLSEWYVNTNPEKACRFTIVDSPIEGLIMSMVRDDPEPTV